MNDLELECPRNAYVQENDSDTRIELTSLVLLKREFGNARLVSGDRPIWVANTSLTHQDISNHMMREVCVSDKRRSFIFVMDMNNPDSERFFDELRAEVAGKSMMELKRKKRKIRKKMQDQQTLGFVPVISPLISPIKGIPPSTPTKSRRILNDVTSRSNIQSPIRHSSSTVSGAFENVSKSPYKSPFRKSATTPSPLSRRGSSPAREFLSPIRDTRVRTDLTPNARYDRPKTPLSHKQRITPQSSFSPTSGNVGNKRVRSLQMMLDAVPIKTTTSNDPILSPTIRPPSLVSDESANLPPLFSNDQSDITTSPLKKTHGLLNLGNNCYMNAIVQALAAVPEFSTQLRQTNEWLINTITEKLQEEGKVVSRDIVHTTLTEWKRDNELNRLVIQTTLSELVDLVQNGVSYNGINPDRLKVVMGRTNAMFATHSQQDAHEFLLQLVNALEMELVDAVHSVMDLIAASNEAQTKPLASETASTMVTPVKRSSLLNFFQSTPKTTESPDTAVMFASNKKSMNDITAHLYPAKLFRAELYHTLTCRSCAYRRQQIQTFYDLSLDLPFVVNNTHVSTTDSISLPPRKRCHCEIDAQIQVHGEAEYYVCSKAACSMRQKVDETTQPGETETLRSETITAQIPSIMTSSTRKPVYIEDLLKKQFEPEVLELTCEKCTNGREAISDYTVKTLPRILLLHLKRFEVNVSTGTHYKRSDMVEPPRELFPLASFSKEKGHTGTTNPRYVLKSVVHHLGRKSDEGHYVSDVCDANGQWRQRNDTIETPVSV